MTDVGRCPPRVRASNVLSVGGEQLSRASLAALVLSAAYFALGIVWLGSRRGLGFPAMDIYTYFYPNMLHAWQSVRAGAGLFWNPYQDCGQPFFAISTTGLLYPVNFIFAVLDREPALIASVMLNLSIAGVGMFQLCRAIGVGAAAALCGALAFELGWAATNLAVWSPMHIGPFAWLPAAMWRCERLVRAPSMRHGLLLGIVLTLQLLPGFPQIVFFTYQLIGLRVGWALLARQASRSLALLAATGLGLALPFFLAAIQLLPSLEVARASVRSTPLSAKDIGPGFSWDLLRKSIVVHLALEGNALIVLIAWLGIITQLRRRWRDTGFYALVVIVYFVLSLGPGSFLFDLYERLPLGTAFRGSARLLWITNFALAVLVGLGAQAVIGAAECSKWWRRALVGSVLVGAPLLYSVAGGPRWIDIMLMAGLLVVAVVALRPPGFGVLAAVVLPIMVFLNLASVKHFPFFGLRRGDVYGTHADVFAFVRERLTPQDRVFIVGRHEGIHPDFSLIPKSASIFRLPSIFDYEPQVSRSYAEFFTFMRTGHGMQNLDDWYWVFGKLMPPTIQRPLFDLTGTRYLVVDRELDRTNQVLKTGIRLLMESGAVRVYENQQALPRAFYVPRVRVAPEDRILRQLANGSADPRRIGLVSRVPRSGFLGSEADASGSAQVVLDGSEHVVVHVRATAPGFLFLADQYFPGWTARVNGQEREILRGNYTFRLVEVPAGESEIVFTYRPLSLRLGAALSMATFVAIVVYWVGSRRACG